MRYWLKTISLELRDWLKINFLVYDQKKSMPFFLFIHLIHTKYGKYEWYQILMEIEPTERKYFKHVANSTSM